MYIKGALHHSTAVHQELNCSLPNPLNTTVCRICWQRTAVPWFKILFMSVGCQIEERPGLTRPRPTYEIISRGEGVESYKENDKYEQKSLKSEYCYNFVFRDRCLFWSKFQDRD